MTTNTKPESSKKVFSATSYRPLPASLTIKSSEIDGLGLFAIEDISEGTYLGETHYKLDETLTGLGHHWEALLTTLKQAILKWT